MPITGQLSAGSWELAAGSLLYSAVLDQRELPGEQLLLTTLVVQVAVAAVLSTMLVRFWWFRRILLTEKRDWPERLIFAASLGIPLVAGS